MWRSGKRGHTAVGDLVRLLLRSSKWPYHWEKRRQRHVDHPGSGAGNLVASRKDDQSVGFGRLQAKRRKIAETGVIAQRWFSKLANFNVRTLISRWRLLELASWAESHNCTAICMQDNRIYFQDSQNVSHWVLVVSLSTVVPPQGNHGVGFVVFPQTASALEDVTCVSDRILHLKLHGRKQKTYLYSAYVSLRNERESFSHLQSDFQALSARDVVVIGLDANAILLVGDQSNKVKFSPNRWPKNNTENLVYLLEGCRLIAVNTRFRSHSSRLSPSEVHVEEGSVILDYMLVIAGEADLLQWSIWLQDLWHTNSSLWPLTVVN